MFILPYGEKQLEIRWKYSLNTISFVCGNGSSSSTYIHPATGSSSGIYLSMIISGSDHLSTSMRYENKDAFVITPKWDFKTSDWNDFQFRRNQDIIRNTFIAYHSENKYTKNLNSFKKTSQKF